MNLCRVFLCVLFLCSAAWALEAPRDVFIESAVYDVNMGDEGFDGFCMLTLNRHVRIADMTFHSNSRVEVITSGFVVDSGDGILRIGGLDKGEDVLGGARRIILRFRGYYSNGTVNLPALDFPYVIERSMVSVSCREGVSCKPVFTTYSLGSSGRILASEDVSSETVARLDSDLLQLRSLTTSSMASPAYRFYMGWTSEERRLEVYCSKSGVEEEFPLFLLLAAGIAVAVILYLAYRKTRGPSKERPAAEKQASWQKSLESLPGDEREIYSLLAGSGGEMLQKDICNATGFSKAKVSRLIDRLEQRGLAERRNHGITRRIVLK